MQVYQRKKVTKLRLSLSSKKDEQTTKESSKIKKQKKTRKSTGSIEEFVAKQKKYFDEVDKIVFKKN